MKKFLLASFCAALALAGCKTDEAKPVEPPKQTVPQQIAARLDFGGPAYGYADYTALVASLRDYSDEICRALLASELPDTQKERAAGIVKTVVYALTLAGVDGEIGIGASSVALDTPADSPVKFRNVGFKCHGYREVGGLWTLFGDKNRDLTESIKVLPANTLFAVNFECHPMRLLEILRRIESTVPDLPPLFSMAVNNPDVEKYASYLSGEWTLLAVPAEVKDENDLPFQLLLAFPDKDKMIFDLAGMLPARNENGTLYFAPLGAEPPKKNIEPVAFHCDGFTFVYSNPAALNCLEGAPLDMSELGKNLPANGLGFFYSSEKVGEMLADALAPHIKMRLPIRTPRQFGVITHEPNGFLAVSNSSWNLIEYQAAAQILPFAAGVSSSLAPKIKGAQKKVDETANIKNCTANLKQIAVGLYVYAADHKNVFPAGEDIEGLRELLKSPGYLKPEILVCPGAAVPGGDVPAKDAESFDYPNCSYVYFNGIDLKSLKKPSQMPVVIDWPYNHREKLNIAFADGHVESIERGDMDSCRKVVSYLHSRSRFDEADFLRMMKTAEKLDKKFIQE